MNYVSRFINVNKVLEPINYEAWASHSDYIIVKDGVYNEFELEKLIDNNINRYICVFIETTKHFHNSTTINWTYELDYRYITTKDGKNYFNHRESVKQHLAKLKELIKESQIELEEETRKNFLRYIYETKSPENKHLKPVYPKVLNELIDNE